MRVLRKAAECCVAHEYIRLLGRSKKASSRRENDVSCSRQSRFLRGRSDGANGWCRGPRFAPFAPRNSRSRWQHDTLWLL